MTMLPVVLALKCVAPTNVVNTVGAIRGVFHGTVGGRSVSCETCTIVVETAAPHASITGTCGIEDFRHRRRLGIGAIGPYENSTSEVTPEASGAFCARGVRVRVPRPKKIPPCTPASCPPAAPTPLPRRCCRLDVSNFTVPFDIDKPPTHFAGTYTCTDESGLFELNQDQ